MAQEVTPEMVGKSIEAFNLNTDIDFTRYDYLVSTLGPGYTSIICFFQAIKPKEVLLIVTPETKRYVDEIVEYFRSCNQIGYTDIHLPICQSTDMPEIYKHILNFCEGKDTHKVLFDATAGKKTMTSAAAMAASFLNADLSYGDFDWDFKENQIIPGTEKGILLDNPYSTFGDLEKGKAQDLMYRGDFVGAIQILSDLKERVPDNWTIRNLKIMAESLNLWNLFFYSDAKNILQTFNSNHAQTQDVHQNLLKILSILTSPEHPDHYAVELANFFFTAKRYAICGKHDLGVLLMFRTIERYAQVLLLDHGINASKISFTVFTDKLFDTFCTLKKSMFKSKARIDKTPPPKVSCLDSYLLLFALEDKSFPIADMDAFMKNIDSLCKYRNQSIYAHGTTPLTNDTYLLFEKFTRGLLGRYLGSKKSLSFNQFQSLLLYDWIKELR